MEISLELQKRINEACLLFDEAEKKIKYIEMIGEDLPIPAINELRYAGCHITRSWSLQNDPEGLEEVNRAIKHGKRANYDAIEIGILYYLENLRQFQEDYRMTEISSSFPEYIELCNDAEKASQMVLNRDIESRGDFWENLYDDFRKMEKNFKKLKVVRPELNKKLKTHEQDKRKHRQRMAATFLAIIVTIVMGLFSADIKEYYKKTKGAALASPLKVQADIESNSILTSNQPHNIQSKNNQKKPDPQ